MKYFYRKDIIKGSKLDKNSLDCWVSLVSPTKKEIGETAKGYGISEQFITYALDEGEPPRIDRENGTILIICRIPVKEGGTVSFSTIPLGIILSPKALITVVLTKASLIEDFMEDKAQSKFTTRNIFFLQIFNRINFYLINYLHFLDQEIDKTEKILLSSFGNEEITKLLKFQKTLVYFNTAALSNGNVLDKLAKGNIVKFDKKEITFLEDVIIENKQALQMINIHTNILSDTMDAYTSIISNNLNKVMKFLTSVTIILALPTMIASYYGMNVNLPYQQQAGVFAGIMVISVMIVAVFAVIFLKKKYF